MYKMIRIALFALPLAGGVAWAQSSGTSGSSGFPGDNNTPPATNDTRTPIQEKAGRIDDTTPVLPGDATKPTRVPNTVEESNRPAVPSGSSIDKKPDDSTNVGNKADHDLNKDQQGSDK